MPRPLALATTVAVALVVLLYGVTLVVGSGDDATATAVRAGTTTTSGGVTTFEKRATKPLIRTGAPTASPYTREPCFGAAAHDPARECRNPRLRLAVTPTPKQSVTEPNAVCVPVGQKGVLLPCEFGLPEGEARQTFALIGDSHASHWRAALERVAQTKGWRGVSITRSSCPFTTATALLSDPATQQCADWNRATYEWLRTHPEVHTVFVSEHSGGSVLRLPGQTPEQVQIAGYVERWSKLPASVTRIFVIRDTPRNTRNTGPCVAAAIKARKPAGTACALPRRFAVRPDPAVTAAHALKGTRVHVIDLTRYLCSPRLCQPVIGGALVHKDSDHLTQTFSATVAPYFVSRIDAVIGADGPPLW